MNKITFLGTAGDSNVAGKQIRASGGIVIQIGELQFHIDPGPGALVRAAQFNVNLRGNVAVLVSNSSLLHCNDANAVIDAMTYGGTDKKGILVANSSFIDGADGMRPLLSDKHKSFVERIIMLNRGQKLAIEDVEVHALPTINSDPNAVGYKFLAPDFTLVYTSDTKYSRELVKEYAGADILILNVPEPGEEKVEYQLNSEAATKLIQAVNPKLVVITHFGVKMLKADPLYEGREMQKKTNVQVLVAKDGMSISPSSYAARSNQKRLNTYKDQETGEVKVGEIKEEQPQEEVSEFQPVEEQPPEESHEERQEHLGF